MKRLITLVLVLIMLVLLLAMPAGAVSESGSYYDISWNYDAHTKTLAFSGTGEMPEVDRYIFVTKNLPLLIFVMMAMATMAWMMVWEYRQDALGFRRKVTRRTAIVLTAVTLGCLLGLLWDKLGLNKAVDDYGILLYWLAGFVPEPYRKLAMDWADQIYMWIYILIVTASVATYQFYVGRCWLLILGKPGRVLVPLVSFSMAVIPVNVIRNDILRWQSTGISLNEIMADFFVYIDIMPVIFALGILLGLLALGIWAWRSRKRGEVDREYLPGWAARCFAVVSMGLTVILGICLLTAVGRKLWKMTSEPTFWWVLGIAVVACILWTLFRCRKGIGEWFSKLWPRIGKMVRIGIIVVAVIAGYCVFSVQINGNFQSEYYAEQITVVHHWADSEDRTMYCVDFTERELRYYVLHSDGNQRLCWTKNLKDEALDAFVETCNDAQLLGRQSYWYVFIPGSQKSGPPDEYCKVYTYSVRGERLVFDGSKDYVDKEALMEALDEAFYELTGYYCLTDS